MEWTAKYHYLRNTTCFLMSSKVVFQNALEVIRCWFFFIIFDSWGNVTVEMKSRESVSFIVSFMLFLHYCASSNNRFIFFCKPACVTVRKWTPLISVKPFWLYWKNILHLANCLTLWKAFFYYLSFCISSFYMLKLFRILARERRSYY